MSQTEGDANDGLLVGAKPLISKIARWMESDTLYVQLVVEPLHERLQGGAGYLDVKVSDPHLQNLLVR